jgi:hypothetical protein
MLQGVEWDGNIIINCELMGILGLLSDAVSSVEVTLPRMRWEHDACTVN